MSTRTKTPKSTKAKGKNKPGTPIDKNPVQDDKVGIPENGEPVTNQEEKVGIPENGEPETKQEEKVGTPETGNPATNQEEKVGIPENGEPETKQEEITQPEPSETLPTNSDNDKKENSTEGVNLKGNEPGLPAEILKRAKEVFSEHKVDVIYCTNDGTMFLHPQFARMHAQGLKDNSFITIKRQEV